MKSLSIFQLEDTERTSGESEVKFQVSRDTLGAMLRSMAYIREQLSSMAYIREQLSTAVSASVISCTLYMMHGLLNNCNLCEVSFSFVIFLRDR